jgi:hypothetical protein
LKFTNFLFGFGDVFCQSRCQESYEENERPTRSESQDKNQYPSRLHAGNQWDNKDDAWN